MPSTGYELDANNERPSHDSPAFLSDAWSTATRAGWYHPSDNDRLGLGNQIARGNPQGNTLGYTDTNTTFDLLDQLSRERQRRCASVRAPDLAASSRPAQHMGNTSSSSTVHTNTDSAQEVLRHNEFTCRATPQQSLAAFPGDDDRFQERVNHRRDTPDSLGHDLLDFDFDAFLRADQNYMSDFGIDIDGIHTEDEEVMAPERRQRQSNSSVVDLTDEPTSSNHHEEAIRGPISLKRVAASSPQDTSNKRARRSSANKPANVEELDLTNEAPFAEEELLQAQQEEAIRAQQASSASSGPLRIGQRQCIICMENLTNATITHCGHIYCHECLYHALLAGEKASDRAIGNCPVCRKPVSRKKANHMIPLSFMKKSAFERNRLGTSDKKKPRDREAMV